MFRLRKHHVQIIKHPVPYVQVIGRQNKQNSRRMAIRIPSSIVASLRVQTRSSPFARSVFLDNHDTLSSDGLNSP